MLLALIFAIGCGNSDEKETSKITESDIVGKWKLTFREGDVDEAGYLIYEFNEGGTGHYTEFDNGGIDCSREIKKWYYDSDKERIICIIIDEDDGDTYPMELQIVDASDNKQKMKWIWLGEDNNAAYPAVKL
jgi:hypothetical protein